MKLVAILYLEDDERLVEEILKAVGVSTFSRMDMEGHGAGVPGWFGEVPSYRSRLLFTWVSLEQATDLLEAVAGARGVQAESHPIHALQVNVEAMSQSGPPRMAPVDS